MFTNVVPVTTETHKNTKIKPISDFSFAKPLNIASVMLHEFSRASSTYPIVFLEDKEADLFRPMVLMGLEQGENLFIDDKGAWRASYIPAIVRRYPFTLARTPEADRFTICVDESSNLVSTDEGQALFEDNGDQSQMLQRVKQYLGELQQMEAITTEFSKMMAQMNMFVPLNMRVRQDDKVRAIAGCYVINEERLGHLSDEKFLELRNKKYLAPIYAHLSSLAQVERLLRFKEERVEETTHVKQDAPEGAAH